MALSVVNLYRDVLNKTNCGDCGYHTCFAFASMVVSEKLPLKNCPHLSAEVVNQCDIELAEQYAAGKWLKRDMAQDALRWARERVSSMKIEDLPERLGGNLLKKDGEYALELPYFKDSIIITKDEIFKKDESKLSRWEQVFIYNHMAQGGRRLPSSHWKGFVEFPNTVSKMKSMINHVEKPLKERFEGKLDELLAAGLRIGGEDVTRKYNSADIALQFRPLPRVPIILLYWNGGPSEGIESTVKLSFNETITEHLDLESIIFLSEALKDKLCGD
jgi:hypothetical protein